MRGASRRTGARAAAVCALVVIAACKRSGGEGTPTPGSTPAATAAVAPTTASPSGAATTAAAITTAGGMALTISTGGALAVSEVGARTEPIATVTFDGTQRRAPDALYGTGSIASGAVGKRFAFFGSEAGSLVHDRAKDAWAIVPALRWNDFRSGEPIELDGALWLHGEGLIRFSPADRTLTRVMPEGRADFTLRAAAKADGRLWVASDDGVYGYEPKANRFTKLSGAGLPQARPGTETGYRVWVATRDALWFRDGLNPEVLLRVASDGGAPRVRTYRIPPGTGAIHGAGTELGLTVAPDGGNTPEVWFVSADGRMRRYRPSNPMPSNPMIVRLLAASGRRALVQTGGGLVLVDPQTLEVRALDLAGNPAAALLDDGLVWAGVSYEFQAGTALVVGYVPDPSKDGFESRGLVFREVDGSNFRGKLFAADERGIWLIPHDQGLVQFRHSPPRATEIVVVPGEVREGHLDEPVGNCFAAMFRGWPLPLSPGTHAFRALEEAAKQEEMDEAYAEAPGDEEQPDDEREWPTLTHALAEDVDESFAGWCIRRGADVVEGGLAQYTEGERWQALDLPKDVPACVTALAVDGDRLFVGTPQGVWQTGRDAKSGKRRSERPALAVAVAGDRLYVLESAVSGGTAARTLHLYTGQAGAPESLPVPDELREMPPETLPVLVAADDLLVSGAKVWDGATRRWVSPKPAPFMACRSPDGKTLWANGNGAMYRIEKTEKDGVSMVRPDALTVRVRERPLQLAPIEAGEARGWQVDR